MRIEVLSIKTILFASVFSLLTLQVYQAKAGCTGLCIHRDSTGLGSNITDTVYASPMVTIYASYNGACAMLMAADNVTLIWCRNGIPVDTTDMTNAVFDGVWTYTTPLLVSAPGTYTVYFKNFLLLPGYECGRIVVLPQNNASALSTIDREQEITINSFSVFPNPAGAQFTIQSNEAVTFEILNSYGQLVTSITANNTNTEVETSFWEKGLYFVRKKGTTEYRKLIIG